MSRRATQTFRENPPDTVSFGPRWVLYLLLDCANDKDLYVWMGNRALVHVTGFGESTVKRHLDELVRLDMIKLIVQGNGARQPTVYRVNNGTPPEDPVTWHPDRKALLRAVGVQVP